MFSPSKIFLEFFFAHENMKKPASKVAEPAQIQPKSQFLFHKNLPPHEFSIMTMTRLVVVGIFWAILTNDSLDGHMSAVRKLLPCLQMDELVYSTESDVNKLTQHFKMNRKNRHFKARYLLLVS